MESVLPDGCVIACLPRVCRGHCRHGSQRLCRWTRPRQSCRVCTGQHRSREVEDSNEDEDDEDEDDEDEDDEDEERLYCRSKSMK